jgi:hypothetical protein
VHELYTRGMPVARLNKASASSERRANSAASATASVNALRLSSRDINFASETFDIRPHVHRMVAALDLANFELAAEHVIPTETQILSEAE